MDDAFRAAQSALDELTETPKIRKNSKNWQMHSPRGHEPPVTMKTRMKTRRLIPECQRRDVSAN